MAYTDSVGDLIKVVFAVRYSDGQVQQPGFHMVCATAGGADTRLKIVQAVDAAFASHIHPYLSTDATYFGTRVSVEAALTRPEDVTSIKNLIGGDTGLSLPTQARPLATLTTGFKGRSFRGRVYMPTPSINQLFTDNQFTPGAAAAYQAFLLAFQGTPTFDGSTWSMVVKRKPDHPPALYSTSYVTSIAVGKKFATQRRSGALTEADTDPWVTFDVS